MTQTILIYGASGKAGSNGARAFETAGWQVKRFNRATESLREASQGVNVILNAANPPKYHDWQNIIPQITRDVIDAAKASGATVLIPGNVYHFGDTPGVWSEITPPRPVSRKGQIRLEMEQAYRASGVQTIVLRAGDFIDPNADDCVISTIYMRGIVKGSITLPSDAHIRHAFCYLPDWARALVALAQKRDTRDQLEDIPFEGLTLSGNDIKNILEKIANRDLKFTKFPWGMMRLLCPFWELARELQEMRYLWNTDHALSPVRLNTLIPDFQTTDAETVLHEMYRKVTA